MGFIRKTVDFSRKIKELAYPITVNYVEESGNILEQLGLEENEDDEEVDSRDDGDDDMQACNSFCVCVLLVSFRKMFSQIKKKPIVFPALKQLACKNLKMLQINHTLNNGRLIYVGHKLTRL